MLLYNIQAWKVHFALFNRSQQYRDTSAGAPVRPARNAAPVYNVIKAMGYGLSLDR